MSFKSSLCSHSEKTTVNILVYPQLLVFMKHLCFKIMFWYSGKYNFDFSLCVFFNSECLSSHSYRPLHWPEQLIKFLEIVRCHSISEKKLANKGQRSSSGLAHSFTQQIKLCSLDIISMYILVQKIFICTHEVYIPLGGI